ncbi:right-handed parallel beta-helix repeat-containing protein [Reichenbachiella agarivorans]|uniref:Right-handed parallel beta-helix repeat-containing protein n=1 Tax=Reichenbachiella agarivorans TaxID=2979464 RepID=A0ABY6CQ44_9BACT|nr:right-handed parallel beta-helix repeat-containing protein [Reichenbachiella agarivorans]UXP32641.1 right-handed parallel beta-helix repeat-containing protein [Reichenbachiella agarivorans]
MKKTICYCALLLLGWVSILSGCEQPSVQIFVDVSGPQDADGSKEKPFPTLAQAIARAEQIKSASTPIALTIEMEPGEYYLSSPILISPLLSGLTLKGKGSDQVVLKGSVPLDLDWKNHGDSIVVASLNQNINFDQFLANGKLQILARYPNYSEEGGYWQGHAADAISPERIQTWQHPEGAYFHAMHSGKWGGFHFEITGVDSTGNAILAGGQQNNRPSRPHEQYRMVENVLEELDSPGEWFLDRDNQKIYYWPELGLDLATAKFEGTVLENLISIQGDEKEPVRDVVITGIKFEHTKRTFMNEYEQLLRSDWSIFRGGALFVAGAEHCSISDCEFVNLGGNVVFVSGYNRDITLSQNHIHESGASAICFVGESSAVRSPAFRYGEFVPVQEMDTLSGPQNDFYPKNCLVENNLIYRIGRVEKQTAGVEIAMSMNITVRNNSIYDVPRAGINIGDGTWGGHVLEYNDVFNTVLETGDHGSFNSWGRDRFWHPNRQYMDSLTLAHRSITGWDAIHTTVIRNNRFRCDHGWDIDLDDGSTNYHIYNNLCLNGGIKLREGFDRVVENNIMINNGFHPHVWFANSKDIFRNNITMKSHQDVGMRGWGQQVDHNLFTNEDALQLSLTKGVDSASVFGDPLFLDPTQLNFEVGDDSPALKVGFQNFPMDAFGVQIPALKALAKTPEVPIIDPEYQGENTVPNAIIWMGMKLKSIETMAEQSAAGLHEMQGAWVMKIMDRQPKALGVREGDVILKIGDTKIRSTDDLLGLDMVKMSETKAEISVMRNQAIHTQPLK